MPNKSFSHSDLDLEDSSDSSQQSSTSSSPSEEGNSEDFPKERENGLSYWEILVNFLKGMIGPGCLSLPLAFKQAGLWVGEI
jgi:hypothetical protein